MVLFNVYKGYSMLAYLQFSAVFSTWFGGEYIADINC